MLERSVSVYYLNFSSLNGKSNFALQEYVALASNSPRENIRAKTLVILVMISMYIKGGLKILLLILS